MNILESSNNDSQNPSILTLEEKHPSNSLIEVVPLFDKGSSQSAVGLLSDWCY